MRLGHSAMCRSSALRLWPVQITHWKSKLSASVTFLKLILNRQARTHIPSCHPNLPRAGRILSKLLQLRLRHFIARIVAKDQPASCGKLRNSFHVITSSAEPSGVKSGRALLRMLCRPHVFLPRVRASSPVILLSQRTVRNTPFKM